MPQARDILCSDGSKPDSGIPREKKKKEIDGGKGGKGRGGKGKGNNKANEVPQVLPPKFGAAPPAKPRFPGGALSLDELKGAVLNAHPLHAPLNPPPAAVPIATPGEFDATALQVGAISKSGAPA